MWTGCKSTRTLKCKTLSGARTKNVNIVNRDIFMTLCVCWEGTEIPSAYAKKIPFEQYVA